MAVLGSFLRKLNAFKQEDTGIERYPIFRNKNSHPSDYYMDVVIPDNIPKDYQKEICNVRINRYEYVTVNCGQGGYSQTYDIYYEVQIIFGRQPWHASYWDMNRGASSYQVIVKSENGTKLAVFEPDYAFDGSFYTFSHFSSESEISSNKPRYFYIDGTRYDFGDSTYNGDYIVVNGSVQTDTRKTLVSPTDPGYVLLNDWSSLDPLHPQPTIGYIPLSTDPTMLAVYKNRVLYANKYDSIRCQGCDNANSACTYCDGLAWYGGDCGTCNIACFSGDSCPDCYKVVDTEIIEVCDQCHDVSDTEKITHEEEVEKEPEVVPTTCVVEGATVDEGDGAIGYCIDGCVGCDGCNGPCNEEFTPAVYEINCKGTADQTCTGAACTAGETATEEKEGTCTGCNILSDDDSEWEEKIKDPEDCVADQSSSTICIAILNSRCTGIGNKVDCPNGWKSCNAVDSHRDCPDDYVSGDNSTDGEVDCKGGFKTDGAKTKCPDYTWRDPQTGEEVRCIGYERDEQGEICGSEFTQKMSDPTLDINVDCPGGYKSCHGANAECPGYEGRYGKCPGDFSINSETGEISCIPDYIDEHGVTHEGCFGAAHGTWIQCVGAACTSEQTATEKCSVEQAGDDVTVTCTSSDGGSATCDGGIHGVCTGVDYDDEYCSSGVYVPVCKGGATISCDPCYITSYGSPGCPGYGSCTPCRGGDSCPLCFGEIYTPPCGESCEYTPCEYCPDYNPCDYNPCEYGSCSPCRICYGLSCTTCRSGEYCMNGD